MLAPFDGDIHDIAFVYAHTSRRPDGSMHPYSVAAIRLSEDGRQSTYASHIRVSGNRARDWVASRLSQGMLDAAPEAAEVCEQLAEFLDGCTLAMVFAPQGATYDVADLLPDLRVVDIGFLADFFAPWLHIASFKQMWDAVEETPRTKVSHTATEGAQTALAFTKYLLGTMLADSAFPAARALRYYLDKSGTLFGRCVTDLLRTYPQRFTTLITPAAGEDTGDWMRFLEQARAIPGDEDEQTPPLEPVPEDDIRELFEELAARRPGYRVREPQVEFAQCVAHALNTGAVATVEAGTGTGKTLGYLLPSMEFLRRNPARRIAIATYTKSLQDQVYAREVESCVELFGHYEDIPVALVKGKSNYVCAQKLDDVLHPQMTGTELLAWLYLANICYRHREADCDDVSRTVRQHLDEDRMLSLLMSEVSAKSGCSAKHTRCPAQVVTAEARHAQLVITNHNKLSVMDHDGTLGGRFSNCIIDEANHFENAVRTAFSPELSSSELFGYLRFVHQRCAGLLRIPGLSQRPKERAAEMMDAATDATLRIDDLRERFLKMEPKSANGAVEVVNANPAFTGGELVNDLIGLRKALEHLMDGMALFNITEKTVLPMRSGTRSRLRSVRLLLMECVTSLEQMERDVVREEGSFASVQVYARNWVLTTGSVNVGGLVRKAILAPKDAVVFTSATITLGLDFAPFNAAMGITEPLIPDGENEKPTLSTILDPPFTPDSTLALPADAADGGYRNKEQWRDAVLRQIPRLIEANKGATLVLFASYEDLDWVRERLEASWDSEFPLLFQQRGEPASALCDEFRAVKESVLFGVETFWHGVDFPGDTLTQVIITRLPFPSVSAPLQLARRRSMPEGAYWARCNYDAYIKFRQGVGRLVRREDDAGRVVVLDSRIASKNFLHITPLERMAPVTPQNQSDRSKAPWTIREDLHLIAKLHGGMPMQKLAALHRRPPSQLAARVRLLDCSQTGAPAPWPDDVMQTMRERAAQGDSAQDIAAALRCNLPAARLRLALDARRSKKAATRGESAAAPPQDEDSGDIPR
ncbi:ATP-dependent DNA helicase [Desulfobaculum sp.]